MIKTILVLVSLLTAITGYGTLVGLFARNWRIGVLVGFILIWVIGSCALLIPKSTLLAIASEKGKIIKTHNGVYTIMDSSKTVGQYVIKAVKID